MLWIEQARLLLRKARQARVVVARAVDDLEIADEIVGFHVQQAAEKCMKAVLCARGISYRRTHDLQELHDLLHDAGVPLPDAVRELVTWSPFAVAYRYEDWAATDPVDRTRAHELVRAAIAWTEGELPSQEDKA
jgi:HEPN domain-containing protein